MDFGFAVVESVLADVHSIRSKSRSAFAARLKHFQRLGFPEGVNTGRGRAANYNAGHLVQLAFALELVQLGVPPERASVIVSSNIDGIAAISITAVEEVEESENPLYDYWTIAFVPSLLMPLMIPGTDNSDNLLYCRFSQISYDIETRIDPIVIPRLAYTNVTLLFERVITGLSSTLKIPEKDSARQIVQCCKSLLKSRGRITDDDDGEAIVDLFSSQ